MKGFLEEYGLIILIIAVILLMLGGAKAMNQQTSNGANSMLNESIQFAEQQLDTSGGSK